MAEATKKPVKKVIPSSGITGLTQTPSSTPTPSLNAPVNNTPQPAVAPKPAYTAPIAPKPKVDFIRIEQMESAKSSYKKLFWPVLIVFILIAGFFTYELWLKNVNFLDPLYKPGEGDGTATPISDSTKGFVNPINGLVFSHQDADKFKDRKPIAMMVNNYVISRPSKGLSQADIVYEAVAEGGITRLMPIFWSRIPEEGGYIRSARYYFAELAAPYKPHYLHWGAAYVPDCQKAGTCGLETLPETDAYARIVQLGLANLDGGNYACDRADCEFTRNQSRIAQGVPIEHTAYVRLPLIYDLAKQIRVEESWHKFQPFSKNWMFKDDASLDSRGSIGLELPITYNYWDTMAGFNVKWVYDRDKNEYIRWQGDVEQIDELNGQKLAAKSIIIRFTKQRPAGDKKNHLIHDIVGTGEALIFQDGNVIKGMWSRLTHEDMDTYTDESGKEIEFVRGQIWVQLVPEGNKITYQGAASNSPAQ